MLLEVPLTFNENTTARVRVCTVSYTVVFVVWRLIVASPLAPLGIWPVTEVFAVWALIPLPFMLVAGLMWRSRWTWSALLIPLLWFGGEYGALFVPEMAERAKASVEERSLRVMTLNTWKQNEQFGEFAATVEQWQPDLIALEEVGPGLALDLEQLSATWPYQVQVSIRSATRVALLSKFPILSQEADADFLGCHCAQLVVEWHGQRVRVIVVHVRAPRIFVDGGWQTLPIQTFDTSAQAKSYAKLLPLIQESREPLLVLGDFNTTERQAGYKLLYEAGLKDAHEEAGWGLGMTYPAPFIRPSWLPFPVIRIDHVFYDGAWQATRTWTEPLMGSDHQAVFADLRWFGE